MARSYQCWDCGTTVSADEVARYEIGRWSTSGGSGGGRFHRRTQRVNLCPSCLEKHVRRDRIKLTVILLAIGGAVLYFLVLR
jgi:hypothetical protein